MLKPHQDAYGRELMDFLQVQETQGKDAAERDIREIVERDDGFLDAGKVSVYFAEFPDWPEFEREAMAYVRGRVLDVGCGAGRHALYLQSRGQEVVGIDVSPLAVEVCKRRGVKDVRLCSVTQVNATFGTFDTIIMMCNNFGLLGNPRRAPLLLRRLARMTTPDARIVAQTNNIYATTNPGHLAYQERNRKHGRISGQLRIRVRRQCYCTPWFDYLMASPEEVETIIADTPWQLERIVGDPSKGCYIVVLGKRQR